MILVLLGGFVFAQEEAPAAPAEPAAAAPAEAPIPYTVDKPSFSGEATFSWGIDLGDMDNDEISHGFLNESSAKIVMPFVSSINAEGEGDVYAFIHIKDAAFNAKAEAGKDSKFDGALGNIEAKIVFYGAYITINNAPSMRTSYGHKVLFHDPDYSDTKYTTGFGGYGTKIGYANKDIMDLDVGLKFASNGSWKDRGYDEDAGYDYLSIAKGADPDFKAKFTKTSGGNVVFVDGVKLYTKKYDADNNIKWIEHDVTGEKLDDYIGKGYYVAQGKTVKPKHSQYAFGIDFHMVPVEKYLTIDAAFNMTLANRDKYENDYEKPKKLTYGFGVKLSSEPVEGLTLDLGFDGGAVDKFAWDLGFGAKYEHGMAGTFKTALYVASENTVYGKAKLKDSVKTPGTEMAVSFGYALGKDLVKGLDFHVDLAAYRLLSTSSKAKKDEGWTVPLSLELGASYKYNITDSMHIKPYFDMWGSTNQLVTKKDVANHDADPKKPFKVGFGVAYKICLEFAPMERLTIDAAWTHGSSHGDFGLGYLIGTNTIARMKTCQDGIDKGTFVLSAKITY